MKIKVINNTTDVNVTVNKSEDGKFCILVVDKKNSMPLGKVKPGSTIKIGDQEFIVLGHGADTTAVISKGFVKKMAFGKDNNYKTSDIRKYLNGEYLTNLANLVGIDNIVPHTVDLLADDGTNKREKCVDCVALLTTDQYRRYREFLPAMGEAWYTATPVSRTVDGYACYVCYVSSDGILDWSGSGWGDGVRPFCILSSSISNFELV